MMEIWISVIPLDRQEQFLWELSQIPQLEERIEAIILQATFPEKFYDIEQRLNTMLTTCKSLRHNKSLHWILSLILHVGNYLNGQSSERGQADGFGLDILPKLKDLKGKDNSTTVLNYVCRAYLKKWAKIVYWESKPSVNVNVWINNQWISII